MADVMRLPNYYFIAGNDEPRQVMRRVNDGKHRGYQSLHIMIKKLILSLVFGVLFTSSSSEQIVFTDYDSFIFCLGV